MHASRGATALSSSLPGGGGGGGTTYVPVRIPRTRATINDIPAASSRVPDRNTKHLLAISPRSEISSNAIPKRWFAAMQPPQTTQAEIVTITYAGGVG